MPAQRRPQKPLYVVSLEHGRAGDRLAMALLHRPALLIADEVTSAVDLLTQREVLSSLRRANADWGTAVLHITHDLFSVPEICHELVVLEEGRVVESGPCARVLNDPTHPYTRRLIEALPSDPRGRGAVTQPALMGCLALNAVAQDFD